jgi:SAM-dependent methyltransferase
MGTRRAAEEGFNADAFHRLAGIEDGNYWFESRNRLILWALRRYFPDAQSFFEMGCGTGFVLRGVDRAYPELELAGAEVMPAGLEIAKTRVPHATLWLADARDFSAPRSFDVVGAFDVLEHLDDDAAALRGLYAATRPGGGLLITVPQHPQLWSHTDEYSCHVRRYRRSELAQRVESAGFEILRATSFVSLLLPLMALSRKRRPGRDGFDSMSEFRIPALANSCLKACLGVERLLIKAGVSWPVGGSLLMVARRRRVPLDQELRKVMP